MPDSLFGRFARSKSRSVVQSLVGLLHPLLVKVSWLARKRSKCRIGKYHMSRKMLDQSLEKVSVKSKSAKKCCWEGPGGLAIPVDKILSQIHHKVGTQMRSYILYCIFLHFLNTLSEIIIVSRAFLISCLVSHINIIINILNNNVNLSVTLVIPKIL